jgi:hypothetical protein
MNRENRPNQRNRWKFLILCGLISQGLVHGQTVLLQESFETDGEGSRYTTLNGSDDAGSDYFARREVGSANTYGLNGGDLDGTWFWGIQDIDGEGVALEDLASDEGRVTFNPVNVTGYANLTLTVAVAQAANEVEFDNALMFEYRVDGGEWITVGGFRGIHTNSAARYFEGDATTYPEADAERLNRRFRDFTWNIFTDGTSVEVRFYANANGGNEGYYLDNIRLTGEAGVPSLGITSSASEVSEDAGAGAYQLNFALETPAPAGGLEVGFVTSDYDMSELDIPSTLILPAGTTSYSMPIDVINDGGFDGDERVYIYISAPGYARQLIEVTVTNIHAKPNLLMTEVYASPTSDDITTDSNGDGVVDTSHDEYVELVNLDTSPVDISGWIITDDLGPRHFVPANTVLQPNQPYVVFGGGDPTGLFGGAIVHTASTGNIAPSGRDTMTLLSGTGIVTSITFDAEIGDLDYSVVLADESNPSAGVVSLFTISGETGAKFTPGLRNDGSTWGVFDNVVIIDGLPTELSETDAPVTGTVRMESAGSAVINLRVSGENAEQVVISPSQLTVTESPVNFTITPVDDQLLDGDRMVRIVAEGTNIFLDAHRMTVIDRQADIYNVVINEALSSVLGTAADPNNNGLIEEPLDDLFIELVNNSSDWVNLGGWTLDAYADNNLSGAEQVHEFPNPTWLAPMGAIVIFGGGDAAAMMASGLYGDAVIQIANRGGNGVNLHDYEGNEIILKTPYGHVEDYIFFDSDISDQAMSVVRSPDLAEIPGEDIYEEFTAKHFDVSMAFELFSPGRDLNGQAFSGSSTPLAPVAGYFSRAEYVQSDGIARDPSLGFLSTSYWPYVYIYGTGSWVYSIEGAPFLMYDFGLSAWVYTNYIYYPWYYNYSSTTWEQY